MSAQRSTNTLRKDKKLIEKSISQKVVAAQLQTVADIAKDLGTGIGVATFVLTVFDQTQEFNKMLTGLICTFVLWYTSSQFTKHQHLHYETK